tara:strand:- start:5321 stop:6298 length:978 start_codon:yes stop_codon:yes gene_type:complete
MWDEKIRPLNVNELVGQDVFTNDLTKWENITQAPRAIILAGPSGTGKTSAAYVAAYHLLGDSFNEHNFTITNGSDERGIDFIRNDLKNLMRIKPIDVERKIVVIDEADGLTPAAQDAARQIIETYAHNALVILTVNELEKLRPAIQSRCSIYGFKPITPSIGAGRLWEVLKAVETSDDVLEAWTPHLIPLVEMMEGDLRSCINLLESLSSEKDSLGDRIEHLSNLSAEDGAELILEGNYMKLRHSLHNKLNEGIPLRSVMRKLYYDIEKQFSRNESDKDKLFDAMAAYGHIMDKIYVWPMSDKAFCDFMVASIRKEEKRKEKKGE